MTETYLEKKERGAAAAEEKDEILFGLAGGILLMLAGGLRWLTAEGFWEIACVCAAALGLLIFLLGIAAPGLLKHPYRAFRFLGNAVGRAVFWALLTVLYFLLIFPVGLLLRRKRQAQGCRTWEQTPPEPRSMFVDAEGTGSPETKGRASYLGILYQLLSILAANKKYILFPAVIILVLIGLILFFASSNVLTAFIYTLF